MNPLFFDLTVDKDSNTVSITREFAADKSLVWDAFTKKEILDQWWAPKPYRSETKTMDFKEGGFRLYAMVSPKDERHWAREDYEKIDASESFTASKTFCDEKISAIFRNDPLLPHVHFHYVVEPNSIYQRFHDF